MSHPSPTATTGSQAATRKHLLTAAAGVFAERGFRDATVREICRKAGANVAAISYHFGDKEALYSAVLRETAPTPAGGPNAPLDTADAALSPEERFTRYIRDFLFRIAEDGPDCLHSRIMAREMIEPTRALDHLVNDFIRPQHQWFQGLIREITGPGFTAEEIRLIANSAISQVLFYKHCGAVIERLQGSALLSPSRLHVLADHITTFSLAAIHSLALQRRPARRASRRSPAARSATPSKPRTTR